jgi:hypothetical protein
MEVVGPALFGLAVVVIVAAIVGLRTRRRQGRVPMTEQSDWTSGGDGSL